MLASARAEAAGRRRRFRVDEYEMPNDDARQIIAKTTQPQDRGWRFATDGTGTAARVALKLGTAAGTTYNVSADTEQPVSKSLHAAAVYVPSSRAEIYIDGALLKTDPAVPAMIEDTSASVFVGCAQPGGGPFKGAIDELRVYARALDGAAIAALAR